MSCSAHARSATRRSGSGNAGNRLTRRPVSRVLSSALRRLCSHSSGSRLTPTLTRHTRGTGWKRPICAPYSVLLQAGFTMPGTLPPPRWALTPPFHPYSERIRSGLLSVALSLGSRRADVIRRPVSMEPGLSSSITLKAIPATARPSGQGVPIGQMNWPRQCRFTNRARGNQRERHPLETR